MRHWKAFVVAGAIVSVGNLAAGTGTATAQAVPSGSATTRTATLNYPPTPSPTLGATTAAYYPSAYPAGYHTSPVAPGAANGIISLPSAGVTTSSVPVTGAAVTNQPVPEPKPAKRQSALARFFASRHSGEPRQHVRHSYADPSTGRSNLPLSKPWLKPVW